jgi:biotin synthase-related radical SAM superfamily protein
VQPLQERICINQTGLPEQIRVSTGTAMVLGLLEGKLDAEPTTAYLMTYKEGKCSANCGFCPQARESKSTTELLSRVSWPTFPTRTILKALCNNVGKEKIKRICIQALNYPQVFAQIQALVEEIKKQTAVPVSVSCQPLNKKNMQFLAEAGVDMLGIALDGATEAIFEEVKGIGAGSSYNWKNQFEMLSEAIVVFGKGNVSTHLIVGLGETEKEAAQTIQKCVDMSVEPALFAFTPIRGTALENILPPAVESYRRVQLARNLIVKGLARFDVMHFDDEGKIAGFGLASEVLRPIIESAKPFLTSGCQDCNRPFYNEKASGPIYNYSKKPSQEDLEKIKQQFNNY